MKKNYNKKHICSHCGRVFIGKGKYCRKHYDQLKKYGKFLDNNPRTINDPNEIITENGLTYIITYDKFNNPNNKFIIDPEDVQKISKFKWFSTKPMKSTGLTYLCNNKLGLYHRFIMQPGPHETVDHINRNTFDNRKSNLRIVSQTEQNHNQKVQRNIRFDIKGIDFHKDPNRKKRYMVRFSMNKKTYRSPWYSSFEEAVFARFLLEQLANVDVINGDMQKYISKLTNKQKEDILTWFKNRFKDRV